MELLSAGSRTREENAERSRDPTEHRTKRSENGERVVRRRATKTENSKENVYINYRYRRALEGWVSWSRNVFEDAERGVRGVRDAAYLAALPGNHDNPDVPF